MDSLELNKAAAAVLTAGIAFFVTGLIGTALVHQAPLKQTAIKIEIPQSQTAKPSGPAPIEPVTPLLASADVEAGHAYTQKACAMCHTFNEGGKALIGPPLYGVVDRPQASVQGFDYSNALKDKKGKWSYQQLNEWLYKPAAYAPGTRMGYAGEPNVKMRANIIAYLRTLSPNPVPLPTEAEIKADQASAKPTASAAPASGGPAPSFNAMLASADPAAGQKLTMQQGCVACHSFNEGGKAGIGPNLYGVVGAPHGHMAGYDYSAALKAKQGPWTYDELNTWLAKPAAYAPGTKMTYAGLADEKKRADIVAYLRTLSPHPEPLPAPAKGG